MCAWQLDEETEGDVIYVPEAFDAETGLLLTDDLRVGKEIAGGAQVCLWHRTSWLYFCACNPLAKIALIVLLVRARESYTS